MSTEIVSYILDYLVSNRERALVNIPKPSCPASHHPTYRLPKSDFSKSVGDSVNFSQASYSWINSIYNCSLVHDKKTTTYFPPHVTLAINNIYT